MPIKMRIGRTYNCIATQFYDSAIKSAQSQSQKEAYNLTTSGEISRKYEWKWAKIWANEK